MVGTTRQFTTKATAVNPGDYRAGCNFSLKGVDSGVALELSITAEGTKTVGNPFLPVPCHLTFTQSLTLSSGQAMVVNPKLHGCH